MSKNSTTSFQLDHAHCRAICDEIGERLGAILKPQTSAIPQQLLELIQRFKQLDEDNCIQLEYAPSIAPSADEIPFHSSCTLVSAD
jgi:hypothetical protein